MANRDTQKNKAVRQAPKTRAAKSGTTEQGQPIEAARPEPTGEQSAGTEAVEKKEREQYRHGGIPIGSDPRE